MDTKTLAVITQNELNQSVGHYSSETSRAREESLDAYYGKPRGDEKAGRSKIQSLDIADAKESIMAQMIPNVASETVVQFQAAGEDDEPQAQVEGDFVTHLIFGVNHGYYTISEALQDSLLLRNAVARAYVEETQETIDRDGFASSEEEVAQAGVATDEERQANIERELIKVEAVEDGIEYSVRFTKTERNLQMYTVDHTNFMYSADLDSINVEEGRATFERIIKTESDLKEMGVPKAIYEKLPDWDESEQEDQQARETEEDELNSQAPIDNQAMRRIECFWVEMRVDWNGDGIAELVGYWYSGGEVLLKPEGIEGRSYATGTCWLEAHRYEGLSLADRLKSIQDAKTELLRQAVDNTKFINHGRPHYKRGSVNLEQLTNIIPGGPVGMDNPGSDVVYPAIPDMLSNIVGVMNYLDEIRSERVGASLEMQKGEVLNNVAEGTIARQIGVKEQISALLARNFAETFLMSLYLLVHRVARLELKGELSAKLHGKWQQTDPSQWPARSRVEISLGLSQQEKDAKQVGLRSVIDTQIAAIEKGMSGIITSMPKLYQAIIDRDRAAGIDNPEQYYIDPASEEAQQASQQKQQQSAKEQEAQAQLQQMLFTIKEREFESERDEAFFKEYVRLIIEKMKLTGSAEVEFLKALTIAEEEVTDGDNQGGQATLNGANSSGAGTAQPAAI